MKFPTSLTEVGALQCGNPSCFQVLAPDSAVCAGFLDRGWQQNELSAPRPYTLELLFSLWIGGMNLKTFPLKLAIMESLAVGTRLLLVCPPECEGCLSVCLVFLWPGLVWYVWSSLYVCLSFSLSSVSLSLTVIVFAFRMLCARLAEAARRQTAADGVEERHSA